MKLKGTEIDIKELDETISKGATFKPALLLWVAKFIKSDIINLSIKEIDWIIMNQIKYRASQIKQFIPSVRFKNYFWRLYNDRRFISND